MAIAMSLIACKKENGVKDSKKASAPTTQVKNQMNESEISTRPMPAAITDSAGVYHLNYKLQIGQTYPFVLEQKDIETISSGGQKKSQTNTSTDKVSFTVNSFKDGVYDFTVKFISKRQAGDREGKQIVLDTQGAAPADQNMKMLWEAQKALMGNTLTLRMDQRGKILSIKGFEPIYTKVTAVIKSAVKDPKELEQIISSFKHTFNEELLKAQFQQNLGIFPPKGMKIGHALTDHTNLTPDGSIKNTTTFTLTKVDPDFTYFKITGGFPKKTINREQGGMKMAQTFSGVQTGEIKVDTRTGWMAASSMQMNSEMNQTVTDGKQTQTAVQKTVSTTLVNP